LEYTLGDDDSEEKIITYRVEESSRKSNSS